VTDKKNVTVYPPEQRCASRPDGDKKKNLRAEPLTVGSIRLYISPVSFSRDRGDAFGNEHVNNALFLRAAEG